MKNLWNREPIAIVNAVRLCCLAGMTFGLHLTIPQLIASMTALEAVLTLFTRSQVTSPQTLQDMTPATLADAQNATQPVKETVRKLPVVMLACVLGFSAFGCTTLAPKAPLNLTPQVTAKFYATYAIKDLDVIRDFANDANKTNPPILSNAALFIVVDWHESLVKVIHAAPYGWKAAVLAGLDELKGKLSAADYAKVKPYVDSARVLVQEIA